MALRDIRPEPPDEGSSLEDTAPYPDPTTEAHLQSTGATERPIRGWDWVLDLWTKLVNLRGPRRPGPIVRPGQFWCDTHWNFLIESQTSERPIDPNLAAMGLTAGLVLKFGEPTTPFVDACEQVPTFILEGIFDRSRGWARKG